MRETCSLASVEDLNQATVTKNSPQPNPVKQQDKATKATSKVTAKRGVVASSSDDEEGDAAPAISAERGWYCCVHIVTGS